MVQFFIEGGFGMFPVLIFGVLMLLAAARYAADPQGPRGKLVAALGLVLASTIFHAMLTDVAAVFAYVSDPALTPDSEIARTCFVGLMESTRPGVMGGALFALSTVVVAVGVARAGQKTLRAHAAAPAA